MSKKQLSSHRKKKNWLLLRRRRCLAFSDFEWEVNPGCSEASCPSLAASRVPSAAQGGSQHPSLAAVIRSLEILEIEQKDYFRNSLYFHGWGDTVSSIPQQSSLTQAQAHFQVIMGLIINLLDLCKFWRDCLCCKRGLGEPHSVPEFGKAMLPGWHFVRHVKTTRFGRVQQVPKGLCVADS